MTGMSCWSLGALDGRYQTAAEMASWIKARECRDHALVVSARTPSLGYQ